jgi:hypothetical protein
MDLRGGGERNIEAAMRDVALAAISLARQVAIKEQ